MSILPKAMPANAPQSRVATVIPVLYAAIIVVLLVAQLFTFDTFTELLPGLKLPLSALLVYAIAPTIVVCELFALPFLLRMALSPAFRWVSMACGWLVAVGWLSISVLAFGVDKSIGLLGSVLTIHPGVGVGISIILTGLAFYSSWALWPARRSRASVAKK